MDFFHKFAGTTNSPGCFSAGIMCECGAGWPWKRSNGFPCDTMAFHGPIACSSLPLLTDIKHHIIRITATWRILQFWCLPPVEQTLWKVEFSGSMSQAVNVLEAHWEVCCYLRMMHREEGVLGRHDVTRLCQRCSVWVRITAVCDHCNYRDQDLHSIYHHSERSRISHTRSRYE